VVSTLVLCIVDELERALREVALVLRATGSCCSSSTFAPSRSTSPRGRTACAPWRGFARGCRYNRAGVELMRGCGFDVAAERAVGAGMPPIVRPLVAGRAAPPAQGRTRRDVQHARS
jgi:hypothetical protein